jgi:hypothetical protein
MLSVPGHPRAPARVQFTTACSHLGFRHTKFVPSRALIGWVVGLGLVGVLSSDWLGFWGFFELGLVGVRVQSCDTPSKIWCCQALLGNDLECLELVLVLGALT